MIDGILIAYFYTRVDGINNALAILWVDTIKKRFIGSTEFAVIKPKHGFDLVGPVKVAGLDVPIPTADIGRLLGHCITFFVAL